METLKIATTNIRFENPDDLENNWPKRKYIWAQIIKNHNPAIFCTQEGRQPQLKSILNLFKKYHLSFDSRPWISERMYPSVYYHQDYSVIDSGDKWLSKTPDSPGSKSFGSMFPRLMNYSLLQKNNTSLKFYLFNCHLDHMDSNTRKEQAKVLVQEIKKINNQNLPQIICGDFNEGPNKSVREVLNQSGLEMVDPWISLKLPEDGSHHKFDGNNESNERIDWILCSKHFSPKKISLVKDHIDGMFPSDHFPVVAELEIN